MRTPFINFIIAAFLISALGPIPVQAQEFTLPNPGEMVRLSPAFNPPILKGIKVHADNPFKFDFILDPGDKDVIPALPAGRQGSAGIQQQEQLKTESIRLIKYFLASLTIPEDELWVNLSPYEKDRIIPSFLGKTEMGRDLLAQDYLLKQITASLIYPEDELGKEFWGRVYAEAQQKFGTTNIPVNTFNKVWIVPAKAVVYENTKAATAYVVESKLKVMLEQDYLAMDKNRLPGTLPSKTTGSLGSQIIKEIVLPKLEKEVNEGKNFAQLRQVYQSLILAAWYKKKIKDSILAQVYADKSKVVGVGYKDVGGSQGGGKMDIDTIYQQYLQAFKKGVFNYIKDPDPTNVGSAAASLPRKYFSGGFAMKATAAMTTTTNAAQLPDLKGALRVQADLAMAQAKQVINPAMIVNQGGGQRNDQVKIDNRSFLKICIGLVSLAVSSGVYQAYFSNNFDSLLEGKPDDVKLALIIREIHRRELSMNNMFFMISYWLESSLEKLKASKGVLMSTLAARTKAKEIGVLLGAGILKADINKSISIGFEQKGRFIFSSLYLVGDRKVFIFEDGIMKVRAVECYRIPGQYKIGYLDEKKIERVIDVSSFDVDQGFEVLIDEIKEKDKAMSADRQFLGDEGRIMHQDFYDYDRQIKSQVNPGNKDLVVLYGGAGVDINHVWLSTNAAKYMMVNNGVVMEEAGFREYLQRFWEDAEDGLDDYERERMLRYRVHKYETGYGNGGDIYNATTMYAALLIELKALGLTREDIELSTADGNLVVAFNKEYPGTYKSRRYEFIFLKADIARPDTYAGVIKGGFDIYYQRAGMFLASQYEYFMAGLSLNLREGGFWITDDNSVSYEKLYRRAAPEGDVFREMTLDEVLIKEGIRFLESSQFQRTEMNDISQRVYRRLGTEYGWKISVRQKLPQKLVGSAAMSTQKGGIDLAGSKLPLKIRGDGGNVQFNLTPAVFTQYQDAAGFVPIIINIGPLGDLRQFLGAA